LEEFYDMPWCEYLIKCYAWNRIETEKWRRARMIAFNARIGSHLSAKSLPKSEEQFLPLDRRQKKSTVTEEMKELFRRRMNEYNDAMREYNQKND
jgi:hypothetical protein